MERKLFCIVTLLVVIFSHCKRSDLTPPTEVVEDIRSISLPATCGSLLRSYLESRCSSTDFANFDFDNVNIYSIDSGSIFVYRISIKRLDPKTDFALMAINAEQTMIKGHYVHIDAYNDWEADSLFDGEVTFQSLSRDTIETIGIQDGFRTTNLTNTKLALPLNPVNMAPEVLRVRMAKQSPGFNVGTWFNLMTWLGLNDMWLTSFMDDIGIYGYYGGGGSTIPGGLGPCSVSTLGTLWGSNPFGNTEVDFNEEYPVTPEILQFQQDYRFEMSQAELDIFDNELALNQRIAYLINALHAKKAAKDLYPNDVGHKDRRDAFRHTYFVTLNCRALGPTMARRLAEAHEIWPGQNVVEEQMDTHNNNQGLLAFEWLQSNGFNNNLLSIRAGLYIKNHLMPQGKLRIIVNHVLMPSY